MVSATPAAPLPDRRTQAERTALSDQRMFESACALICAHGTAGTTLKAVGERAGYSRGLASHRFGTKAELFAFIIRRLGEQWIGTLNSAVGKRRGYAALSAALSAHGRLLETGAEPIRAFYILWFESLGPDSPIHATVQHVHQRRRDDVIAWLTPALAAGEIRPAVPLEQIADHFCAAITGIVYAWLIEPSAPPSAITAQHDTLTTTLRTLLNPQARVPATVTRNAP
ncbi:MAG: TetR/AcrR family transcriptional regulator [Gammaproteobacteria bacterium]|nr:TetR/AcrR family transcriptional regulator [Gammaproteobacteria bacterium]